jgi:hypothetical protein
MVKKLIEYVEQNSREVIRQSAGVTQRFLTRLNKSGIPASYFSGEDFPLGVRPGGEPVSLDRTPLAPLAFTKAFDEFISPYNLLPVAFVSSNTTRTAALPGPARAAEATRRRTQDEPYILPPECAALSEFRPSVSGNRMGKDHALLIGINEYDKFDRWPPLNNPIQDATSIAEVLNTRFGFATEVVKNVDKRCFGEFLGKYAAKQYGDDEQLFIFFAGHGIYKSNVDGFLIVKDSPGVDPMGLSFISHGLLTRFINAIPSKHIFLVLDSCFGGAMAANRSVAEAVPASSSGDASDGTPEAGSDDELVRTLMRYPTRRFLTSGGVEYVSDGVPGHHSPFTNKFLAAFDLTRSDRMFITLSDMTPVIKFKAPVIPFPLFDSWYSNDSRSDFFFFSIPSSVNAGSREAVHGRETR